MSSGEFSLNVQVLRWAGLASPDGCPVSRWGNLYISAFTAPFVIMSLLAMAYFFLSPFSLINATIYGYILVNLILTIFRISFFFNNKARLENLIRIFSENFGQSDDLDKENRFMRRTSKYKIMKLTITMLVYNAISVLITAILPASERVSRALECEEVKCSREMSYEIWFPTDSHLKPTYYILIIWQMISALIFTAISCSCDAFCCSLTLAASERAAFLAQTAPMALLPGARGQITPIFKTWVKHHQSYLKAVGEINKIMGSLIFLTHGFTGISILAYCYFFMSYPQNPINSVTITTMAGFLVQIFIYSSCGQGLIDQSENLANRVLNASQVARGGLQGSGGARSSLLVVITRLSAGAPPEHVEPLGFFTSSMELFVRLITTSGLYIMILIQLQ
ncbi:uncharacterized protein LOC132203629 [Neocloeon triangulifer]|uniref:uncharacterized protein LOC132203629 n=1 Tax=Neocloeon triangulifer TaxID=2078957 RepID=UPI00286ECF18|nr:uncharacterized protein LOC132203629 [Neocloeon triangulifer]